MRRGNSSHRRRSVPDATSCEVHEATYTRFALTYLKAVLIIAFFPLCAIAEALASSSSSSSHSDFSKSTIILSLHARTPNLNPFPVWPLVHAFSSPMSAQQPPVLRPCTSTPPVPPLPWCRPFPGTDSSLVPPLPALAPGRNYSMLLHR